MSVRKEIFKIKVERYKELMKEAEKEAINITCFLSEWHDDVIDNKLLNNSYWKCNNLWGEVNHVSYANKIFKLLKD